MRSFITGLILLLPALAMADVSDQSIDGDFLIKLKPGHTELMQQFSAMAAGGSGGQIEDLGENWVHLQVPESQLSEINSKNVLEQLNAHPDIEYAQPNYKLGMIEDYQTQDPRVRKIAEDLAQGRVSQELLPETLVSQIKGVMSWTSFGSKKAPEIPSIKAQAQYGADPLLEYQWGMKSIHAVDAWKKFRGSKKMVVAVIDTGVDYTHEDLAGNIWHNPNEIPNNQIDDDHNGFIDDVIGWDFVTNTNKPYDVTTGVLGTILGGGNPGHGTHCAGNVGAVGNNGIGISGVSPEVSIMPLRFLGEKGQGSTAGAVKAINYAVANGAKILSNSWGSQGEDPRENNHALKDAILNALHHDVLFVAAAGNGRRGRGYNNDSDKYPEYPGSYTIPNILSVAAIDNMDKLGKFSNFGKTTVHVGAPGVGIYSTMAHSKYGSRVFFGMDWNGTSMATPHVAGAAALIWAAHPNYSALDVKNALMKTVTKISALDGKTASGGKINVEAALQ